MSQPEIPDNNLPVYLQQYEVNILNTNKLRPCNNESCVSTEKGCCPDNVTPVPPSGDCPIGCAGTQFGCCPYSTEAKVDQEGSNCGTIAGSVLYNTVGAIPSNEVGDRVWQLNLSGFLKPGVDTYYIVYDFQKVNYKYKDKIRFENAVTGTFNTCGRVLDANRYLTTEFCDETQTLTIIIDTKKWGFRLKKEVMFSYTINVDDSSETISNVPLPIEFNTTFTLKVDYNSDGGEPSWKNSNGNPTPDIYDQVINKQNVSAPQKMTLFALKGSANPKTEVDVFYEYQSNTYKAPTNNDYLTQGTLTLKYEDGQSNTYDWCDNTKPKLGKPPPPVNIKVTSLTYENNVTFMNCQFIDASTTSSTTPSTT